MFNMLFQKTADVILSMIFQHVKIQNRVGRSILSVCHIATILLGDVHGVVRVVCKVRERACVARKAFQKQNVTELLEGRINMYACFRIRVNKLEFH